MKVEKQQSYNYKRHLISVLVAGAMALSWGTVAHVQTFMQNHLRPAPSRNHKTNHRSKLTPKDSSTMSQGPTPLTKPEEPIAPVAMAKAKAVEAQDTKTETPKAAPARASKATPSVASVDKPQAAKAEAEDGLALGKTSSASLFKKAASKMGVSIVDTKIDTSFIRKVEGSLLKGYVPLAGSTHSGVTVGDGFDLGQMNTSEFQKLNLSASLKAKLQPYVGMTGMRAKSFVKTHPLVINEEELKEVNVVAADKILSPLIKSYDKASGKSFLDLPAKAQTAIFSYAYQNGPGFRFRSSNKQLWQYFITQNWQKASQTLKGFKMYASRRSMEAHLLDNIG
jgi:hypothetical protein